MKLRQKQEESPDESIDKDNEEAPKKSSEQNPRRSPEEAQMTKSTKPRSQQSDLCRQISPQQDVDEAFDPENAKDFSMDDSGTFTIHGWSLWRTGERIRER